MTMRKKFTAFMTVIACAAGMIGSTCSLPVADAATSAVYGDLNGDGLVNVLDQIHLKQNVIGTKEGFPVTNWKAAAKVPGGDVAAAEVIGRMNDWLLTFGQHEDLSVPLKVQNGIDVSKWQGDVDWEKVKNAGVEFVMIKAGEGTEVEPKFLQNITGAKNAGIQCGIYWFSSARDVESVAAEVEACIKTIEPYQLEFPVVYDFEYRCFYDLENDPMAKDRKLCTDIIYAFLDGMRNAGYYSMLYSNKNFPTLYLEKKRLTDEFDFWYANYSKSLTEPDEVCGIWQRSCTGRIDGIGYDVDLDVSYVDYKTVMETYHLNGY